MTLPTVHSSLISRGELGSTEAGAMYDLLTRHFVGVDRAGFEKDLGEKNWVLLIWKAAQLVGFSTLHVYEARDEGTTLSVVYSGDTIVAREAWGTPELARAWIGAVKSLRASAPEQKWYWLLLSSGFRTYRFLPVFWKNFCPRYDAAAPPDMARLLMRLAAARFGRRFDPGTGLVRLEHPQLLRPELSGIPAGRMKDPHIAFFAAQNPRFEAGDELVCLTELSEENLTRAGRRIASRA